MHKLKFVFLFVVLLAVAALAQSTPTATLTASDGSFGASLGTSEVISDSTVAAGAPQALVNGQNQGAVYVFRKSADAPWSDMTESARLVAPSGQRNLGTYVAMSGDGNTIVSTASSGAYVFLKPANGWKGTITPVAFLAPGAPAKPWIIQGSLGSVAINAKGDTIVSGASSAGTLGHMSGGKAVMGAPNQGAAYVWVEPTGGWANANEAPETAKLTASDGVANDRFGWAVGISANTILAGAPAVAIGSASNAGSAYLFMRPSTGVWHNSSRFQSRFTASDATGNDSFGSSVAIGNSGALVAVGSTRGAGNVPGAAFVFARPSPWWPTAMTQTAELTPSDISGGAFFGASVSVGNQQVIVGAQEAFSGAGSAYTFTKPTTGWVDLSLPVSMVGGNGSVVFGWSESVNGPSTAVGAPDATVNEIAGGAVYVFSK